MITSLFYKIDFTLETVEVLSLLHFCHFQAFKADFQYLLLIFQPILLSFFVAVAPACWAEMVKQSKAEKLYRTVGSTENWRLAGKSESTKTKRNKLWQILFKSKKSFLSSDWSEHLNCKLVIIIWWICGSELFLTKDSLFLRNEMKATQRWVLDKVRIDFGSFN